MEDKNFEDLLDKTNVEKLVDLKEKIEDLSSEFDNIIEICDSAMK